MEKVMENNGIGTICDIKDLRAAPVYRKCQDFLPLCFTCVLVDLLIFPSYFLVSDVLNFFSFYVKRA